MLTIMKRMFSRSHKDQLHGLRRYVELEYRKADHDAEFMRLVSEANL